MNDDELAEAIRDALAPRRRRIAKTRLKAKAAGIGLASLVGGLCLASLGVDGHAVIHGLFLASPVLAIALVGFLRVAWGQNFILPLPNPDLANVEPASQVDPASEADRPVARPTVASQPTVTLAALPLASAWPTIPIAVAKAGEPAYTPWEDPDGDD